MANIISIVSDPNRLANELFSESLLSYTLQDKIVEDKISTTYEKASLLLNQLERSFRKPADDDGDCAIRFNKLCNALVKQDNPQLTKLAQEMKL